MNASPVEREPPHSPPGPVAGGTVTKPLADSLELLALEETDDEFMEEPAMEVVPFETQEEDESPHRTNLSLLF